MQIVLLVFAGAAVLELLVVFLPVAVRRYGAMLSVVAAAFASGGVVAVRPCVASGLIIALTFYRLINMLRLVQPRVNEEYLKVASRRAALWLIGVQAVIFGAWYGVARYPVADKYLLLMLAVLQLLVACVLVLSTVRHLRTTKIRGVAAALADRDLPTVTLAIPARNEDQQMEECLRSALANDYPKLEIIVLDDCSQDNTPEIIRGFAHDGVRFIPGEPPTASWLAKNQAYERLFLESSGELVMFCGVDVRFGPRSIHELVATLLAKKKKMMSVMPLNEQLSASMPQVMRYIWELALPRRMFNRPPVLSSCWLIERDSLKKLGGFDGVSRSIVPEAHFARELTKTDGYSFMRSNEHLGITSVKTSQEQQDTAVRTRYPQLHKRLELAAFTTIAELSLLLAPVVLAIVGVFGAFSLAAEIVLVVAALLIAFTYRAIEFVAFPHNRWMALPVFPFAIAYDVALLQYSLWKYEFAEVTWKGRSASAPVMRVIPHLPVI